MLKYIVAVVIFWAGIAGAYFFSVDAETPYAEATTIAERVGDFEELRDRFKSLAEEKGGAYAYEVLRIAQLPPGTDLHLLGHAVGDVLYEQKGVGGIADCTQDFRNACSHSIVIGALNEYGEAALDMIRESCKKAPGGSGAYTMCYHGLGHGVFAFFNYDLAKTVEFCKKTGTEEYRDREYIECVGGAVMELMGGGGHNRSAWLSARETYLDPARPLAPCMDAVIPDAAKGQCLTYLTPRLWEIAGIRLGAPDPDLFDTAFSYCDLIPHADAKLRDACYGGFGKEFLPLIAARDVRDNVVYSDDQLTTVIRWCTTASAKDGAGSCVAEALSSAFWGGEKDPSTSFRLCAVAKQFHMEEHCYTRLADNIKQYTPAPNRGVLCAQIPMPMRSVCEP